MSEARKNRSLRSLTGLLSVLLIYAVLAFAASILYPKAFNPLANTLSQLGDPKLNPSGAILYNAGVFVVCGMTIFVATALLFLPKQWVTSRRTSSRLTLFYLTVAFMLSFSLFYLLTAIFPASANYGLNSLFTLLFVISLELFAVFSAAGVRRLKDHIPWVPWFGFAAAIGILLLVLGSATKGWAAFSWLVAIVSWSYTLAFIYEFSYKPLGTNQV